MRLIAIFNLKPGITAADYEAWAKSTDLPTVNALPSIESFRVFKTLSVLGSDAAPPYGYIEIIDVTNMDEFGRDVATETMQKIALAFTGMVDVTFMTTAEIAP